MTELYKYTANKKYLDFCYYILDALGTDNRDQKYEFHPATGKSVQSGNGKVWNAFKLCRFNKNCTS